jgi:adenylate kinase
MSAGELVPDELVLALLVEAIDGATARGVVFDGFPRTTTQARALDAELERRGRPPLQAVLIDVPDEVLIARLSGRRICERQCHEYHVDHRPRDRESATSTALPSCDATMTSRQRSGGASPSITSSPSP